MRALATFTGLVGLLGLFAGCSAAPGVEDSAASVTGDLSSGNPSFVALRQDTRKCHAPMCGGFWLHDVNGKATTAETYVGALDFVKSGLDDATIEKVQSAPAGELVLNGRLVTDSVSGVQNLLVFAAYRGMPGVAFGAKDTFYQAADFNPPRECFAAPCAEGTASKLNTTSTASYDRIDVAAAALSHVDQAWLHGQVAFKSAIVAGSVASGSKINGHREQVLTAEQIFVKLPVQHGPCRLGPVYQCTGDTPVATFARDTNLCLNSTGCVKAARCPTYLVACPDGYTSTSWNALPSGCSAQTCDPTFIVQ